jgi:hypothetical protein
MGRCTIAMCLIANRYLGPFRFVTFENIRLVKGNIHEVDALVAAFKSAPWFLHTRWQAVLLDSRI